MSNYPKHAKFEIVNLDLALKDLAEIVEELNINFVSDEWSIDATDLQENEISEHGKNLEYLANKVLWKVRKLLVFPDVEIPENLEFTEIDYRLIVKRCSCGARHIESCGYIESERPYSHRFYKCECGHIEEKIRIMD